MKIFKAIIISSLTIPVLIALTFTGIALVFLISMLIQDNEHNKGWLGMIYGGFVYSYFALLLSSIPTIVFGWPASVIANKYGYLNKQIVLPGSIMLGGLFLCGVGALFFKSIDLQVIVWLFITGAVGGFINGAVFLRYMKTNKSLQSAD